MAINLEDAASLTPVVQQKTEHVSRRICKPLLVAVSVVGVLTIGAHPLVFPTHDGEASVNAGVVARNLRRYGLASRSTYSTDDTCTCNHGTCKKFHGSYRCMSCSRGYSLSPFFQCVDPPDASKCECPGGIVQKGETCRAHWETPKRTKCASCKPTFVKKWDSANEVNVCEARRLVTGEKCELSCKEKCDSIGNTRDQETDSWERSRQVHKFYSASTCGTICAIMCDNEYKRMQAFTDADLHLEHLSGRPEDWITHVKEHGGKCGRLCAR